MTFIRKEGGGILFHGDAFLRWGMIWNEIPMKRMILIKYYVFLVFKLWISKCISKPIVNHGGIINVSKQFIL